MLRFFRLRRRILYFCGFLILRINLTFLLWWYLVSTAYLWFKGTVSLILFILDLLSSLILSLDFGLVLFIQLSKVTRTVSTVLSWSLRLSLLPLLWDMLASKWRWFVTDYWLERASIQFFAFLGFLYVLSLFMIVLSLR